MLESVCSTGSLLFGASYGSAEPRVFFESCKTGNFVFTPCTALGDKICTESVYRAQAVSWKVEPTQELDESRRIVRCLGRRRGIYRMEDLQISEYCLE